MQLLMVQAKNAAPDLSQLPDPSELFGKAKGAADDVSGKAKGAADQASGSAKGAAEQAKGSASGSVNKVSHQLHHTVVSYIQTQSATTQTCTCLLQPTQAYKALLVLTYVPANPLAVCRHRTQPPT